MPDILLHIRWNRQVGRYDVRNGTGRLVAHSTLQHDALAVAIVEAGYRSACGDSVHISVGRQNSAFNIVWKIAP